MSDGNVRDMSWPAIFGNCSVDPLWAANKIVWLDKRIEDLEADAVNVNSLAKDAAAIQDILDGKDAS